jgi:asparagine synthase (glutamine-hydrolysing)
MSVQFGRWNFDGKPVDLGYFEKTEAVIAPYGPDEGGSYTRGNVKILYRAFHATKESRCETQPHTCPSGAVITWDGRLDNRAELIRQLRDVLAIGSTDVAIVAAAYERWRTDCFAELVGDWAVSIWDPHDRSLILAKDFVGTRHLYYALDNDHVTWSTILDPLVLFAGKEFALDEEYIAGWFSVFPAAQLTPYAGIHSAPPSSFVLIRAGKHLISKYWDFDPDKKIRYRSDTEYEEHFRAFFAEAVRRRLRSDHPILAELSGGMDSSSIVCMADNVIAGGATETPRLDTISYYNDAEPNWNERPYFTKVEQKRGRTGCHIDVSSQELFNFELEKSCFEAIPGSGRRSSESAARFAACITSQQYRVMLSGIGGDEVLGGVPTPIPELTDLLATARFRVLAHQLKVWALANRKPWIHLLFETVRGFLPLGVVAVPEHRHPAPWLDTNFVKKHRVALIGSQSRLRLFGPLPSFQESVGVLDLLRRQLGCSPLPSEPSYEKRYPYLDRCFLEFLYSIPREQLVRPGQRRSLMRRALVGLVPDEILQRKRKAFVARAPLGAISRDWTSLVDMSRHLESSSLKIVDPKGFCEALEKARHGQQVLIVPLLRTLEIENWLKNLRRSNIVIVAKPFNSPPVPRTKNGRRPSRAESSAELRISSESRRGAGHAI